MKKREVFASIFGMFLFLLVITPVSSATMEDCSLNVSMINQDPYPVIPGNYVEVVFQVSGTDNSNCEGAKFHIEEDYPLSLDKNQTNLREISGSTFVKDYKKSWMVPYRLRVDEDALDGMSKIDVKYAPGKSKGVFFSKDFNIKVEDVRVDFEISVKEYDHSTNTITFEILNTGENDIEALTINLPEQENLEIKGSPRNIVGSLDSNEETTFDFKAIPKQGDLRLDITYTDEINERRTLQKETSFNPKYYASSEEQGGMSFWFYLSIILIAYMVFRWFRNKKRKTKRNR